MNVHRHAAATRVSVRLRRVGDNLHLVIRDDGEGMAHASGEGGVGIRGMAARVRQLNGRMAIRSSRKGTIVHAALPLAYPETEVSSPGG